MHMLKKKGEKNSEIMLIAIKTHVGLLEAPSQVESIAADFKMLKMGSILALSCPDATHIQ